MGRKRIGPGAPASATEAQTNFTVPQYSGPNRGRQPKPQKGGGMTALRPVAHPPRNRAARRRKAAREADMSYHQLFDKLAPKAQRLVNEKVIWAVNQLTDQDGQGPIGTKGLIGDRLKQLILDGQNTGFARASKRFREAITQKKRALKSAEKPA